MRVSRRLAGVTHCSPMGTGTRHMWRFTHRAFGVVMVFKCHGCELTTAIHQRKFWGGVD